MVSGKQACALRNAPLPNPMTGQCIGYAGHPLDSKSTPMGNTIMVSDKQPPPPTGACAVHWCCHSHTIDNW